MGKIGKEDLKTITLPALQNKMEFEDFYENIAEAVTQITSVYKNETLVYSDMQTKYINIINGNRFTTDNPPAYDNKGFFFGDSTAISINTQDSQTIPSYFQRLLNNKLGDRYFVQNCATPCGKGYVLDRMLETKFEPGDIVFCVYSYDVQYDLPEVCEKAGIDYFNTNFCLIGRMILEKFFWILSI